MTDEFYDEMLNWFAVFARRSLGDFHRFTRDLGLTMPQMNVLMRLYYQGACEVNGLMGTMLVSKAAVSQMVERLVQQGLVQRSEVPGDRRARLVCLTEKGRQIVSESITARQQWLDQIGETLTPEEKTVVAHALHILSEAAVRSEADAPPEGEAILPPHKHIWLEKD
jgi:DNA-binding MarR family transcriptional regulator